MKGIYVGVFNNFSAAKVRKKSDIHKFICKNPQKISALLRMSKKSSTFAGAKVLNENT